MIEACPVCDTLWRLYSQAADNLHELNGKFRDARGKGDQNTAEILGHEITIAESALPVVRRELRRHEMTRHSNGHSDKGNEPGEKREHEKSTART